MLEYAALLRAIANIPMLPFREALEELGFTDVASYGMSGNLLFNAEGSEVGALEHRISQRLGAMALVRTREEMEGIVTANPFREQRGAAVMFLADEPDHAALDELEALDLEGDPPTIVGRTVFFVHPTRPRGKRTSIDLERTLRVAGTARSSRVVSEILRRMSAER